MNLHGSFLLLSLLDLRNPGSRVPSRHLARYKLAWDVRKGSEGQSAGIDPWHMLEKLRNNKAWEVFAGGFLPLRSGGLEDNQSGWSQERGTSQGQGSIKSGPGIQNGWRLVGTEA